MLPTGMEAAVEQAKMPQSPATMPFGVPRLAAAVELTVPVTEQE